MSVRPVRPVRAVLTALAVAALALVPACDATGDDPGELLTDPPFGEEPGDGDAVTVPEDAGAGGDAADGGDEPVPVEGDGGTGGAGGGPVTSSLILSSDAAGADQVEVDGTCLVSEDPPTYRLDLAVGTLTADTGSPGAIELVLDGTTYTSPDAEPPVVSASEGAVSVQGRAVAASGEAWFVDAVIGLDGLPDC